jgi:hypothetical protein
MMSEAAAPGAEITSVRPFRPVVNRTGEEILLHRSPTISGQSRARDRAEDPPPYFFDKGRMTRDTAIPAEGVLRNCGRARWLSSQLLIFCLSSREMVITLPFSPIEVEA